jgi:hypothetical protein
MALEFFLPASQGYLIGWTSSRRRRISVGFCAAMPRCSSSSTGSSIIVCPSRFARSQFCDLDATGRAPKDVRTVSPRHTSEALTRRTYGALQHLRRRPPKGILVIWRALLCATSPSLRHFRRSGHGSFLLAIRFPVDCKAPRLRELCRRQMRGNAIESRSSSVTVYAAQGLYRQEEPGTGVYIVFRRIRTVSIHLRKFTLSTGQTLFGGSQQPLHCLRSVAFDCIPIVIHSAVAENTKIELRGGIAAFRGKNEVLDSAALHQRILTAAWQVYCFF